MTPRTFWTIFIKIMGIYIILNSLVVIMQFLSSALYVSRLGSGVGESLMLLSGIVFVVAFYLLIIRYCVFRTEWIIDKLKLDSGFLEEKFEINIHRSTVLRIAVIVIGGLMFVDVLPILCKDLFAYFQSTVNNGGLSQTPISSGWIIYYFAKLFIGLFMMTCSSLIVNYIELKRKQPLKSGEVT